MNMQDPDIVALIQALQGSASLDHRDQFLGKQQDLNQTNRSEAGARPAYGAMAGMGQGIASALGGIHQKQLADQQQAQFSKRDDYMDALIKALQGGQQQGAAPDYGAGGGMGVE